MTLTELFHAYKADTSNLAAESEFFSALHRWALSYAHHDEDLAQDYVMAAVKGCLTVNGEFMHWMKATAKHIRADRIRHLAIVRRKALQDIQLRDTDDASLQCSSTEIDWESLTGDERHLAGKILSGYSISDISQAEGVTASAVKMRLLRIRQRRSM